MVWIGVRVLSRRRANPDGRAERRHGFYRPGRPDTGAAEVARRGGERASAGCDAVYVSVDVDFIDTGFFPSTGSVVNDAIIPGTLVEILRVLARYPVGAMDLVEVALRIDPSGRSLLISTEVLLGMLAPRLFRLESERDGNADSRSDREDVH